MTTEFQKMITAQQAMLDQWQDFFKNNLQPSPSPFWWQAGNADWPDYWMKYWNKVLGNRTTPKKSAFSPPNLPGVMFSSLAIDPMHQWRDLLKYYKKALGDYIDLVEDIDLPFDEMAEFWGKMLEDFALPENPVFSIMGKEMSGQIKMLINPLYEVIEMPRFVPNLKFWYMSQFHYLSFLIRHMELRSMVLEASLAAWPEAIKAYNEKLEKKGAVFSLNDLYQEFFNQLEADLHRLMKSDDYIFVQNKAVETMLAFKANLSKWTEMGMTNLSLITQSDLDDVAREMEALRVKIRKLEDVRHALPMDNEVPDIASSSSRRSRKSSTRSKALPAEKLAG